MQLRPEVALLLLVLLGYGVFSGHAETIVRVMLPDDESFRQYRFAYLSIVGLTQIDSVVSSPQQSELDVDRSNSEIHRIAFKANLTAGPTATIITYLNKWTTSTRLLYRVAVNSTTTEAAVQVRRPSSASSFLPLWEAYEWLRNETAGGAVQLMPERCPAASDQLCRTRLAFATGHSSVHEAVVELDREDNFLGFNLRLEAQTAEQLHREGCGPSTCLNNGTCDTSYRGAGFRCTCPDLPNIPWGPRCEYPIRSYGNPLGDAPLVFTRHWIGDLPHSTDALELSFELAGITQQTAPYLFELKNSVHKQLLQIKYVYKQDKMKISGSFVPNEIELSDPSVNSVDYWLTVQIFIRKGNTSVVICTRNKDFRCAQGSASNILTPLDEDFRNFWIEIGKGLKGCVQSVMVNGYSVDLAASRVTGDPGRISEFCTPQNEPCRPSTTFAEQNYACGDQSVCYGLLRYDNAVQLECNCRCLKSKRRNFEMITDSRLCKSNTTCNGSPWVISTRSGDVSRWSLSGSQPLPLPATPSVSIEMEIRTRTGEAPNLLTGRIQMESGELEQVLKLAGGNLSLCIPDCLRFPPIRVDDGEWHSVSAVTKGALLLLSIGGVKSVHLRDQSVSKMKSMTLSAAVEKSWLRNIRVSGIYMSTDINSDFTRDPNGTAVIPALAADATAAIDGVDPAPTCESLSCSPPLQCVRVWGRATCECAEGQERNIEGTCVAINVCSRWGISCPSGGRCETSSEGAGFQCVCPAGVASRLCVPRGPESTAAPAMAGFQWWIGLIIGIAALLLLLLLLVLLLVTCRRRHTKLPEEGIDEIDKVHEGMGTDNENEGVPPEDYLGPLSLHFIPQGDSNGGLPNFQPVETAPATNSERPLTASAATPEPKESPDAGGDETLNYGYEDTRDDDAADLDQLSIVSADTDYSFDLKPTLEAWGPKFQSLTDILT